MWSRQAQLIETLDQVNEFLDTNREVMTGVITSAAHQHFSDSRERMVEHMKTQDGQSRSIHADVATKRRLREQLIRTHIRPIAAVAKAELADVGEMAALTMPRRRGSIVALLAASYGMAEAARIHEASLLAGGLAPGFIDGLVAATDALRDSLSAKKQTVGLRVAATAGLINEARVATKRLRVLDSLIRATIKDDNVLLDRWMSISRITSRAKPSTLVVDTGDSGRDGAVGTSEAAAEGLKAA